jgi:hypothetical protein
MYLRRSLYPPPKRRWVPPPQHLATKEAQPVQGLVLAAPRMAQQQLLLRQQAQPRPTHLAVCHQGLALDLAWARFRVHLPAVRLRYL